MGVKLYLVATGIDVTFLCSNNLKLVVVRLLLQVLKRLTFDKRADTVDERINISIVK